MLNFRQFEAGPDPFGRKFQVFFKWLQTAISMRHADTVDVKFVLVDEDGGQTEKTIALPHADLLRCEPRNQSRLWTIRGAPASRHCTCCTWSPPAKTWRRTWSRYPDT